MCLSVDNEQHPVDTESTCRVLRDAHEVQLACRETQRRFVLAADRFHEALLQTPDGPCPAANAAYLRLALLQRLHGYGYEEGGRLLTEIRAILLLPETTRLADFTSGQLAAALLLID